MKLFALASLATMLAVVAGAPTNAGTQAVGNKRDAGNEAREPHGAGTNVLGYKRDAGNEAREPHGAGTNVLGYKRDPSPEPEPKPDVEPLAYKNCPMKHAVE